MKIHRSEAGRLELRGHPEGARAFAVPLGFAAVWALVAAIFWGLGGASGTPGLRWLGGGAALVALAGLAVAAVGALRSDRLSFDRAAGRGRFERRPLFGRPVETPFELDQVAAVELDVTVETASVAADVGRRTVSDEVWTVALALPGLAPGSRRLLRTGGEAAARQLAGELSRWLGVALHDRSAGDTASTNTASTNTASTASASTDSAPTAAGQAWRGATLPEPPAGLAATVEITVGGNAGDRPRITLRWPLERWGWASGVIAVICLGWILVSALYALAWWGVLPSAEIGASPFKVAVFLAIGTLGILGLLGLAVLIRTGRQELVLSPESLERRVLYPGHRLVRRLPGLGRRLAPRDPRQLTGMPSVRTVSRGREPHVEVGVEPIPLRLQIPGRKAEEAKWLAAAVRAGLRALTSSS